MSGGRNECRIYVGNLPPDIRSKDVEDLFFKFGKLVNVDLKNSRGPPFAFVEFEDARDCEDAVHARDGYDYDGYKLRVELPRGDRDRPRRGGPGGRDRGGGGSSSRGRGPPSRRTNYRVVVSGLPTSGSWQDLKDHMREAGEVAYADVFKDGTGVVEYARAEDMQYALRKLDDSKFKSHEGETAYVRLKEDSGSSGGRRSRSRSYSPRRGGGRGSPSYSPMRKSHSRSRSRSRSPRDPY